MFLLRLISSLYALEVRGSWHLWAWFSIWVVAFGIGAPRDPDAQEGPLAWGPPPGRWTYYRLADNPREKFSWLVRSGNILWVSTSSEGIFSFRISDGTYVKHATLEGYPYNPLGGKLFLDRAGALWVYPERVRYDGVRWTEYDIPPPPGLPSFGGVGEVAEDRSGNLWFGSWDYGLVARKSGNDWTFFFIDGYNPPQPATGLPPYGVKGNHVEQIVADAAGDIWVVPHRGGLYRYDGALWTAFYWQRIPANQAQTAYHEQTESLDVEFLPGSVTPYLWADPLGPLWVGGVILEGGTRWTSPSTPWIITPIVRDSQGNTWYTPGDNVPGISGSPLVLVYQGARWHYFGPWAPTAILEGWDGRIVAGDAGALWFAVLGGLVKFEPDPSEEEETYVLPRQFWGLVNSLPRALPNDPVRVNELIFDPSSGALFAGTNVGVLRSLDNGDSWKAINHGLRPNYDSGPSISALAINPTNGMVFAGTWGWGVFRSADSGTTWTPTGLAVVDVSSIAVGPKGTLFAGTTSARVFRSMDNGSTWTLANSGLSGSDVNALLVSQNGNVFAGIGRELLFRSVDNGDTWAPASRGLEWDSARGQMWDVVTLASTPTNVLFAGTTGGDVFRSFDNGDTWVATGLTSDSVHDLAITPEGFLFAGTIGEGVFRSLDSGDTWTAINSGLSHLSITAMAANLSGVLVVGTYAGGFFRNTQTLTGVEEGAGVIDARRPAGFELLPNYPNPFNTTAVIRFGLPSAARVSLDIYGPTGQVVRTILDEQRAVGVHEVRWDGKDSNGQEVATGVYLCRLATGRSTATRKMMLVR